MKDYIPIISAVFAAAVAIGIAWRNHSLTKQRDRETREHAAASAKDARKRDFRAAMVVIRDSILAVKDSQLIGAHKTSLLRLREECAKIEADIATDKINVFKVTANGYCTLPVSEIECRDKTEQRPPNQDQFGSYQANLLNWQPRCQFDKGRERIKLLLDKLIECAK